MLVMGRKYSMVTGAMLAVVLLAGATGCASGLDMTQLEQDLAEQYALREQVDASEVTVTCPDSVDMAEGTTFECPAAVGDAEVTLVVTMLDADGTVEWRAEPVAVIPPE
jgi:hypothetical protein